MFADTQLQVTVIRMACKRRDSGGREGGKEELILPPGFGKSIWLVPTPILGGRPLGDSENNKMGLSNSHEHAMTSLSHHGGKDAKVLCTGIKVNPFIHFLSFPRSLRLFFFLTKEKKEQLSKY